MPESEPTTEGHCECDETRFGEGIRGQGRGLKLDNKSPVFGIIERNGRVRFWRIPRYGGVKEPRTRDINADVVYTDESTLYKRMPNNPQHDL